MARVFRMSEHEDVHSAVALAPSSREVIKQRGRAAAGLWFVCLALAVASIFLPGLDPNPMRLAWGLEGYPAGVLSRSYQLIRAAMPWIPAGMLLAWAFPVAYLRLAVACTFLAWVAIAAVVNVVSGASILREVLYTFPGLALGLWLGRASAYKTVTGHHESAVTNTSNANREAPKQRVRVATLGASVVERTIAVPSVRVPTGPLWARATKALIGVSLLVVALWRSLDFPVFGLPLAIGMLAYAAVLWWRPLAWLVVVPAALPLLDLAPWTGRIYLDEFDVLGMVTLGVLLLRRVTSATARPSVSSGSLLIGFYLTSAAVSMILGLLPLTRPDGNSFFTYWSQYNALRVGKGFIWGAAFYLVVAHRVMSEAVLARLLSIGMAIGLLGVCLVGVWERWLYAGLGDDASTYRIVSTFSSMHTGGGHIEAYLVATVPFLWLGLRQPKTAVLAGPLLLLAAYVMLYTVSRGGVLAFGVIAVILGLATFRSISSGGAGRATLAMLVLGAIALILVAGAGSGYLMERFAKSAEDWKTRADHWQLGLRIADDSWVGRLFGTGLGTFPRRYLEKGPMDRQSGTYALIADPAGKGGGETFLRLGVGDTLYVAQRIDVEAGARYRLVLNVRAQGTGGRLAVPICEKQLLNSRRCAWNEMEVSGSGAWHTASRDIDLRDVGRGAWWRHLPVELFFYNSAKGGSIDIDRVQLLDGRGRNVIANGDFLNGGDRWFFKTHSHLPWHLKNVWVHVVFEMGIIGAFLFALVVASALYRLGQIAWSGSSLAWVLLASLSGLLTVGVVDSLLDAPRLALLLLAMLFLGVTFDRYVKTPS